MSKFVMAWLSIAWLVFGVVAAISHRDTYYTLGVACSAVFAAAHGVVTAVEKRGRNDS